MHDSDSNQVPKQAASGVPGQGMTWPPLKWTGLETHCCRMVQEHSRAYGAGHI